MIVSRPIKENPGNGYATDDENNESNKEDSSTDEEKIESDEEIGGLASGQICLTS